MDQNDRELDEIVRIARAAAAIVMDVYATPFAVEMKGPGDPVTRADREANALICSALEAAFPGEAILAEESVPTGDELASRLGKERVFFVDPLDGTREFADRNGEFAVMIGLAVRGRAALGVVVMPTTGEALAGRAGGAAFLEARDGSRRPLRVSAVSAPADATLIVSRSHRPKEIEPLLARLGISKVVPCGSVGVKIARIATGEVDLYVHGGGGAKLWDSCAPEAVLLGAGGSFTDLSGAPIDYNGPGLKLGRGIIASNGALQAAVVAAARSELG
ncbi:MULTISPECIES: 3'(2'),5'-bisphosphate nucleotidase CysQ family protein [Sorangium]|uniref:Inositol monophosphatase family protein CysQ n=1 Tax=Sorangium cellulosum (strain So ce56) TaxID=448385 RepID=A9EN76_SORC5|nr:3'(2'),5'-bisphosphate nucleotidase CysQ [Sorangium cellulosum]CAN90827.1 Inositol monophosphatase family protein CysQ [Sorangium cellulosum So ce56]